MKRLYLMRHASAEIGDVTDKLANKDPGLTADGMTKARAAARGLEEFRIESDLLITSPLLRANQTAEIVAEVLRIPGGFVKRLDALKPEGTAIQLLEEIARLEGEAVFCVGHSPQLDDLISHILGCKSRITALKRTAVACLEIDSLTPPKGLLLWLFPPKALRRLGK
jgi:phosphohistidine phosphatase